MAATAVPEYRRLRPETPDQSNDGSSLADRKQDDSPPTTHRVHLPTKAPTVRYVPHSGWSRYKSAVQTLIPVRRGRSADQCLPLDKVGLFSYITFNWLLSTVNNLEDSTIPENSPLDSCDINGQRLHHIWREEGVRTGQLGSSLFTVMWRFVRTRVIVAVFIYIVGLAFSIQGPVICLGGFLASLRNVKSISYVNSTTKNAMKTEAVEDGDGGSGTNIMITEALLWALGFVVTELISIVFIAWSWSIICRTAGRLRSAIMALIYNKLVRLSNLNTVSTQQMVTLMGTDGQKLYEAVLYGPHVITAPIVLIACALSCFFILTDSDLDTLIAMSVFLLSYPLLYVLVRLASHLSARATALCTRRLALVYEMLVHIRLVKMTTWENVLTRHLKDARNQELGFTSRQYLCDGFCLSTLQVIPAIALVLFLCSKADVHLEAYQLFPVLALFFGHMKYSLFSFWLGVKKISDVFPSLERFKSIMLLNEANKFTEKPINRLMAVNISNASFLWNNVGGHKKTDRTKRRYSNTNIEMDQLAVTVKDHVEPVLVDITFLAPKGKLIGVCGAPKCGKTSLLLAVLGHLHQSCGQVSRDGNCAYVGQRPWIWTASVRDNIVFKEPFLHKRYYNAVHSCCLNEDINQLPHHDETQIDEIRLSPGQKQRIALARALYSNRDIYLLDNPLSMVDADMGAAVFDKCILKALHGRTVILATRQVQFMTRCDEVYVMDHGKILQSGTHEQLMKDCPQYSTLIKTYTHENAKKYFVETTRRHDSVSSMTVFLSQHIRHTDSSWSVGSCEVDGKDVRHLDNVDLSTIGTVGAYITYLASVRNYLYIICGVLSQLLYNAGLFGVPLALLHFQNDWTDMATFVNATLIILMCVSGFMWSFSFSMVVVGVSQRAHESWFEKLCRAPMGYFQASPAMMSVLNLFSLIDLRLPQSLRHLLDNSVFFFCAILMLMYISPYTLAIVLLMLFVTALVLGLPHRRILLKLHEIEVASRVPLYEHLVTTITGRTTIQAFAKDKEFISDFTRKCDDNGTSLFLLSAASRWLAVRVQLIAAVAVGLVAAVLVFSPPVLWSEHLPAEWIAGLVLVFALQLGSSLQHILETMAESEARLRMFAESSRCIQGIRSEGYASKTISIALPANWPTDGSIVFEDVKTKTLPGTQHALNEMSFNIKSGQKIGVVGLPGSGKKLVVDALFRLVELSNGRILVGGTDIARVPLEKLRSSVAIVPQDPVLFTGSIRLNIDPHRIYRDSELWESLQKVNLKERIERLPQRLNTLVDRNGDKLTVGERQLLCLARACLRDTKVLVLEEPLATVGGELDSLLNHVAWNLFPSSTVITIAHQMKYVVHCDQVIVVQAGKVVEFDTPTNLYKNRQSFFSKMISASTGNLFETEL
ncbi:ATP-binding cassette sub-family C member 12-like isoform X2 [Periplaneta americana]|uniref:ATP-binding cassette sub-family C member 12-like isoform X2 n=1 Tax=Periplaneta americana TaxID=6978 RepID=UPI0037E76C69